MSFLTSFWLLPQKEQERFPWSSRLRSVGTVKNRSTGSARSQRLGFVALYWCFYLPPRRLLDEDLVDEAVLLGLDRRS